MHLTIETEREADGRWIAEVPELPGVVAYGTTEDEAAAKAEAMATCICADRLEHGEICRADKRSAIRRNALDC